jgi:hypothetical protein
MFLKINNCCLGSGEGLPPLVSPQTRISQSFQYLEFQLHLFFPPTEQSHAASLPTGLFISLVESG